MKKYSFVIGFVLLCFSSVVSAQAVWQWSVPIKNEQGTARNEYESAYLWIPENCKKLKAVIFAQHNMIEEGILEDPKFRRQMAKLDIGQVCLTGNISQSFSDPQKDNASVNTILSDLAIQSGYQELKNIPIIPMGHSAMATFPWNFALANPNRTLAVISLKGDAPATNLTGYGRANVDWNNKNVDHIPGLVTMSEQEWWQDRFTPGFKYVSQHPNSPITWFADAGRGHFDFSDQLIGLLNLYLKKVVNERIDKSTGELKPVDVKNGWLMEGWKKDNSVPIHLAAKYSNFTGDRHTASWCFDKEMVNYINNVYQNHRGKRKQFLGLKQQGKILDTAKHHANYLLKWQPQTDGVTFNLKGFFADSTKIKAVEKHANTSIHINRICGPVEKINDTTFRISHTRIGLNNPKRSNDIWLMATNDGDNIYKSVVQQALLTIPNNTEGINQKITFDSVAIHGKNVKSLPLGAISTSGLKVSFYVKEGPAYIKNGQLVLTKIPPKTKFPVKVTVVAWQMGLNNTDKKIKAAIPVTRVLYVNDK
ncbi:hypothetical protein D3C87_337040 [compost metagenome]